MKIIGLTGGSGAGKGYISEIFSRMGIECLDTDQVSRSVCQPGTPCLAELCHTFGEGILHPDGSLDRKGLAALAFADAEKLLCLNQITHHYILDACRTWLEQKKRAGAAAAVIDAPQLFESGFDRECDCTAAVIAPLETRIERIIQRDGLTREQALLRLSRQHTDEYFSAHCDYIIMNGPGDDPEVQIRNMMLTLLSPKDKP